MNAGDNPKKAAGAKKRQVQLVPPALTLGAAVSLEEGAEKYGAYNWRDKPIDNMTYIGAIVRHAMAYQDGEEIDPESTKGKSHLEGIAGCIAILLDSATLGILIDTRPKPGAAPRLTRSPGFVEPSSGVPLPVAEAFVGATRVPGCPVRTCTTTCVNGTACPRFRDANRGKVEGEKLASGPRVKPVVCGVAHPTSALYCTRPPRHEGKHEHSGAGEGWAQ